MVECKRLSQILIQERWYVVIGLVLTEGIQDDADPERHAYNIQESTQRGPGLMDFEIPIRNNWVKSHKLVGIGLISTSLILVFVYLCFIK